jgi:hypothetical protein
MPRLVVIDIEERERELQSHDNINTNIIIMSDVRAKHKTKLQ